MPFATFLSGALTHIKNNSFTALNLVIALGTIGIEQIFSAVSFKCPCKENTSKSYNRVYGFVYLAVPAIVLLILGYILNPNTWKLFTGVCRRTNLKWRGVDCYTTLTILLRALIAPISWICIALLDGQYYACAVTAKPYNQTCKDVYTERDVILSLDYHANVSESQVIGWITTSVAFVVGMIIFTIFRCSSNMTHWQSRYMEWTKEIEGETFEKKARETIKEAAETNVDTFIKESRKKEDWDKVATVFCEEEVNATPPEDGATVITNYSSLQKWTKDREDAGRESSPNSGSNATNGGNNATDTMEMSGRSVNAANSTSSA